MDPILTRTQFHRNRHCERSAAISLGQGTLLRERDRHVASLLAMTKWVRVRDPIRLTLPQVPGYRNLL